MFQIAVLPSVNEACVDDLAGKTAVVIDVLRATSSIITALHHGCAGVVPVETVYLAKESQTADVLLGGERNGRKIPGFDLGNSPFEYMSPDLAGKKVIMTTTNGTRAIQKSSRASQVIAAAMLNARAAASCALAWRRDIVIVCAGTKDRFSLEDGLCAGLFIHEIESLSRDHIVLNDLAIALRHAYLHVQDRLEEEILACHNGRRLSRIGLTEDVLYCAQTNRIDLVPVLSGDTLVPLMRE